MTTLCKLTNKAAINALKDASLSVHKGQFIAVVGKSGFVKRTQTKMPGWFLSNRAFLSLKIILKKANDIFSISKGLGVEGL